MKTNFKLALLSLAFSATLFATTSEQPENLHLLFSEEGKQKLKDKTYSRKMAEVVNFWKKHFAQNNSWEKLTEGVTPFQSGCGSVYVLPGLAERPNESLAIADMRQMPITHPHYHNIETEIYFVLQGTGTVIVAGKEIQVKPGSIVVTQPGNAHFTVPSENHDLVMAVVNNPPFDINNFINVEKTNNEVGFNKEQYTALQSCCSKQ